MSQHPHPSITARYRALGAFALLWLAGIILVVASGFRVDGYMLHVLQIPLPHPYPLGGVVATCLVLTLECALIYAVIRPASYEGSWGRALSAVFVAAIELVPRPLR